jgi:hypothetical protein
VRLSHYSSTNIDVTLGNETISHIREPGNGRITVLFMALNGAPKIVRLFGKGKDHISVFFAPMKVFSLRYNPRIRHTRVRIVPSCRQTKAKF